MGFKRLQESYREGGGQIFHLLVHSLTGHKGCRASVSALGVQRPPRAATWCRAGAGVKWPRAAGAQLGCRHDEAYCAARSKRVDGERQVSQGKGENCTSKTSGEREDQGQRADWFDDTVTLLTTVTLPLCVNASRQSTQEAGTPHSWLQQPTSSDRKATRTRSHVHCSAARTLWVSLQ